MSKKYLAPLKASAAFGAFFASTLGLDAYERTNYEHQPSEGYHAEEWYDPSDWFDDDVYTYNSYGVDYESDPMGDMAYWDEDEFWESDYDYDYNYDYDYGTQYVWDDINNEWVVDYGYGYTTYAYDPVSYTVVYSQNDRANNRNDRSNENMRQRNQMEQHTLNGEIEGFRHMRLKADGDSMREYTVTRIELENGKSVAVNLGEKERLDDLDLESGDDVKIKGVLGKVNGEPLFIANKVMIDDRTFNVNRAFDRLNKMDGKQNRDQKSDKMSRKSPKVQGVVETFRATDIEGLDEQRTLALVRLESGKAITVDLGESRSVSGLDLENGDEVKITGSLRRLEGKRILQAERIWINGEKASKSS